MMYHLLLLDSIDITSAGLNECFKRQADFKPCNFYKNAHHSLENEYHSQSGLLICG